MNRSTTRDYNLIEQCALLFQESYFGSDKRNKPVSKREKILQASHWTNTSHTNSWPQQKLPKFGFGTHTTALWPIEQSSILSAKFDCLSGPPEFFTFGHGT